MSKKHPEPDVVPDQVWADNDWRMAGRTLRVLRVDGDRAQCVVVTPADTAVSGAGRIVSIATRRFRPTSTGYRLVSSVPASE